MTIPWPRAPFAQTAGAPIFSTPHATSWAGRSRGGPRRRRRGGPVGDDRGNVRPPREPCDQRLVGPQRERVGDPEPPERDARLAKEGDDSLLRRRRPLPERPHERVGRARKRPIGLAKHHDHGDPGVARRRTARRGADGHDRRDQGGDGRVAQRRPSHPRQDRTPRRDRAGASSSSRPRPARSRRPARRPRPPPRPRARPPAPRPRAPRPGPRARRPGSPRRRPRPRR